MPLPVPPRRPIVLVELPKATTLTLHRSRLYSRRVPVATLGKLVTINPLPQSLVSPTSRSTLQIETDTLTMGSLIVDRTSLVALFCETTILQPPRVSRTVTLWLANRLLARIARVTLLCDRVTLASTLVTFLQGVIVRTPAPRTHPLPRDPQTPSGHPNAQKRNAKTVTATSRHHLITPHHRTP